MAIIRTTVGMPRSRYPLTALRLHRQGCVGADQLLSVRILPYLGIQHQVPHQTLLPVDVTNVAILVWKSATPFRSCYDMFPMTLSLRHRVVILGQAYARLSRASKYYSLRSRDIVEGPTHSTTLRESRSKDRLRGDFGVSDLSPDTR